MELSDESEMILGIDEVGRGPWAGPLVLGAVILGPDFLSLPAYTELDDSKKISTKKRLELAAIIEQKALATGLGWVKSCEIDRLGLSKALRLGARRAVKALSKTYSEKSVTAENHSTRIVIDGTVNFLVHTPLEERVTLLKKADSLVKAVSAASIIAKVNRDQYMINLAKKFPNYGFEKHVGYGTSFHRQALEKYGLCPEHRQSFRPVAKISESATALGHVAEQTVANYLQQEGHQIITSNFRTKTCEIDLISVKNYQIYFTEVKYSQNNHHGSPLERISPQKIKQMTYAAQLFLSNHSEYQNLQPILAAASVTGDNFVVETWLPLL